MNYPVRWRTPGYSIFALSPYHQRHRVVFHFTVRVPHSLISCVGVGQATLSRKLKAICMKCQPSHQMFDIDWFLHPASWPNSSSFHPDVLEAHAGNWRKLVQAHRARGSDIFVSCRGRSSLWFPSGHTSQQTPEPDLFLSLPPSLLNHIWTLPNSLSRDFWGLLGWVMGSGQKSRGWARSWLGVPYLLSVLIGLKKQWSQFWSS